MTGKILIVDDSKVARMVTARMIGEINEALDVTQAASGAEALALVGGNDFDMIILDYNMPDMDGLETASKLLEQGVKSRITMLTANIQKSIAAEAERLGVGFLTKPAQKEELAAFLAG